MGNGRELCFVPLIVPLQLLHGVGLICLRAQSRNIIFSTLGQRALKQFLESIREVDIARGHTLRLCVFITCLLDLLFCYVCPSTDEYGVLVVKHVRLGMVLDKPLKRHEDSWRLRIEHEHEMNEPVSSPRTP